MQYINRIMATIALSVIVPTAYSGSLTDTIATGDTLTATLLNNAKAAINDNDSRVTALETLPKATTGSAVPDTNLDSSNGHPFGTVYIQSGTNDVFISRDATIGGAIWEQLTPKKYAIGDVGSAGGWVFFVTGDGLHGFEAAPVDQAVAFAPGAAWGCSTTLIPGADGTRVGRGARNSGDILAGCATAGIAADLADAYTLNGYTDWYLPSQDELNEMYLNIGPGSLTVGNVGGFVGNFYFSSSEIDVSSAWLQNFLDGTQVSSGKGNTLGVRAVRAF